MRNRVTLHFTLFPLGSLIKIFLVSVFLIVAFLPVKLLAQTIPTIQTDLPNNEMSITGWLTDDSSFSGTFRLNNPGDEINFTFLPLALKREGGTEVINSQQLTFVGDPILPAQTSKDFQLKISGFKMSGTYKGQFSLIPTDKTKVARTDIAVTVKVNPPSLNSPPSLVIDGWLGSDNSLSGSLSLRSDQVDLKTISITPLKLQRQVNGKDQPGEISSQQISISGGVLQRGVSKEFQVKISDIKMPGIYVGELQIALSSDFPDLPLVSLEFKVVARHLTIDPGTNGVNITQLLTQSTNFTGTLKLLAEGESVASIQFRPSDLKREGGSETVGSESIVLMSSSGNNRLLVDQVTSYQVILKKNPPIAGIYNGTITIILPAQTVIIPLKVEAKAIALTALKGSDKLQFKLENCTFLCLGESKSQNITSTLHFSNVLRVAIPLTSTVSTLVGSGEKDPTHQLKDKNIQLLISANNSNETRPSSSPTAQVSTNTSTVTPTLTSSSSSSTSSAPNQPESTGTSESQILNIPLDINYSDLAADHYVGTVFLSLKDQNEFVEVPVDFMVRDTMLKPLLVLVSGILIGLLFRFMQSRGTVLKQLTDRKDELDQKIQTLEEQADKDDLSGMMTEVARQIYSPKPEMATLLMDKVQKLYINLKNLDDMVKVVKATNKAMKDETLDNLATIRTNLKNYYSITDPVDDAAIQKRIDMAREAVNTYLNGGGNGRMAEVAGEPQPGKLSGTKRLKWSGFNLLASLHDYSARLRVGLIVTLGPIIVWLILLFGAAYLGLSTLYFNNDIFGANVLVDYAGLFIWGFTADISTNALSKLATSAH